MCMGPVLFLHISNLCKKACNACLLTPLSYVLVLSVWLLLLLLLLQSLPSTLCSQYMFSLTPVAGRENDAKHVDKQQEKLAPKDVAELKEPAAKAAKEQNKDAGQQDVQKPPPPANEDAKQAAPAAPSGTGLNHKRHIYIFGG